MLKLLVMYDIVSVRGMHEEFSRKFLVEFGFHCFNRIYHTNLILIIEKF